MKTTANRAWRSPSVLLLGLVPYCVLLVGAYITFGHSVDDAYITYRYASNLASGHGPVFNVGECEKALIPKAVGHQLVCQ